MVDFAADVHLLDMDFLANYGVQVELHAGLLEAGGCSYQMVYEGEWIDDQAVNLARD